MVKGKNKYRIKDIFDLSAGGDVDKEHFSAYKTSEYRYPIYSNSLENHGLYGYTSNPKYSADSVTITGRGSVGHAEYREDEFDAIIRLLVLKPKSNNVCAQFVADYINNCVEFPLESTGVPQLTAPQIMNVELELPQYDEQKEVTTVLADVSSLIDMLDKQIAKKKAIKQGTMQELLTGKKRLPGFSGDWIKSNIGSCIIEKPSYGINAPAVDFNGFLPRYIRITDISEDGRYCKDAQASVSAENVEPFLLKTNDIVLARTGASVGKSYIYDEHDGRLVYAGFLIKMSIDPQKADSRFIFGVLHTYDYWKWVAQTSMRSGQPGINGEEYASYEFRMPSDLKEQKAIADILTNMDNEIVTLGKKLIKYRQVKQGMMQQLLTGKIRIT